MCESAVFFQAEDGIRYLTVTGVQTCALPICQERAEAAIALCTEKGFPLFLPIGTTLQGWARAKQGQRAEGVTQVHQGLAAQDRKSTRLNSSHSQISYAVFCLKKKNSTPAHVVLLLSITLPASKTILAQYRSHAPSVSRSTNSVLHTPCIQLMAPMFSSLARAV